MLSFEECISHFRTRFGEYPRTERSERQIGVSPCCSDLAQERMLVTDEWTAILKDLVLRSPAPVRIHFFGAPADAAYIRRVIEPLAQRVPHVACEIHAGVLSLRESVESMGWLDEFWCIDSGLLHYARLLGIPTVSFWGPSDPQTRLRPGLSSRDVVHYAHVPCSPCVHLCAEPPCGGNNVCMRAATNEAGAAYLNPIWVLAERLSSESPQSSQERRATITSSSSPAKYQ